MTDPKLLWERYQKYLVRYEDGDLCFSLDVSRMGFREGWLRGMEAQCQAACEHLKKVEAGEPVNAEENRMVGHYWLRNPDLAPTPELQQEINHSVAEAKRFASVIHTGVVSPEKAEKFRNLLLIGIGGSALGPQLVANALTDGNTPLKTWFFDNTDPEGMDRILAEIGQNGLAETLTVVTSKSGGTPETRNGMLEAKAAYEAADLTFAKHAVAITGTESKLDNLARDKGWLERFSMPDWIGGRTSVTSVVGLVPAALQKVDIDAFLRGAAAMDVMTRHPDTRRNAAMLLALMWHWAGDGRGRKDMVILPYKDRLALFANYLQQLVMESLGKEFERGDGSENDENRKRAEQGIAVYGNKGSTDQHAYVQQLRDGVNNFFAVFVEVARGREGDSIQVDEPNQATSADFLQGFLRGTRGALYENGRESVTISIPRVDAFHLGALIALFERAVTFYADLINVNAYHQPGVEAGKKAAGEFLTLIKRVRDHLTSMRGSAVDAEGVADALGAEPEAVYHVLNHLAANSDVTQSSGATPADDRFTLPFS